MIDVSKIFRKIKQKNINGYENSEDQQNKRINKYVGFTINVDDWNYIKEEFKKVGDSKYKISEKKIDPFRMNIRMRLEDWEILSKIKQLVISKYKLINRI